MHSLYKKCRGIWPNPYTRSIILVWKWSQLGTQIILTLFDPYFVKTPSGFLDAPKRPAMWLIFQVSLTYPSQLKIMSLIIIKTMWQLYILHEYVLDVILELGFSMTYEVASPENNEIKWATSWKGTRGLFFYSGLSHMEGRNWNACYPRKNEVFEDWSHAMKQINLQCSSYLLESWALCLMIPVHRLLHAHRSHWIVLELRTKAYKIP